MQHNNERRDEQRNAKQKIREHKTLVLVTRAQNLLMTILTWRRGSQTLTCDALVLCSSVDALVQQVKLALVHVDLLVIPFWPLSCTCTLVSHYLGSMS